jgi:hypothetical protein
MLLGGAAGRSKPREGLWRAGDAWAALVPAALS